MRQVTGLDAGEDLMRKRLSARRTPEMMSPQTSQRIRAAISEHSMSMFLDAADIDVLVNAMELYSFKADEVVVAAGEAEAFLFCSLDANTKVNLGEEGWSEISSGTVFGSSALLYGRTR